MTSPPDKSTARRDHAAVEWAQWGAGGKTSSYTLGVEEEVMLVDPEDWALAWQIDRVMPELSPALAAHATSETHTSALELRTGVHQSVATAASEIFDLRSMLQAELEPLGLKAAASGTHPITDWNETMISGGQRYQFLYGSMRELARREPTFGMHVHIGVADPEAAVRLFNRLRAHVPLLLALSTNSPFWQGRDSGLSSARTPLFQAFPRVGIPNAYPSYSDYVEAIDMLVRCEAIPESTFLWWDVRLQPRFGTVEVRVMDVQTTSDEAVALVALIQSIARLEIEEGFVPETLINRPEVLDENRFIAARDGMHGRLIDPVSESRVPVRDQLVALVAACRPHALDLGCAEELEQVIALGDRTGATLQLAVAREGGGLPGLVSALAGSFCATSTDGMARLEVGSLY